jgi:hypothetical protein
MAMSLSTAKNTRSISKVSETEHRLRLQAIRQAAELISAVDQCAPELQEEVWEMMHILTSDDASEDEKVAASNVINDILFPGIASDWRKHHEGWLKSDEVSEIEKAMDLEEMTFSESVRELMVVKNITQEQLAAMIGVGQPAVSNILSRNSRPQRKTVEKIAKALDVSPDELWRS